MDPSSDSPPFVHYSVPNRSLGPRARRVVLAGIGAMTFAVASGATFLGAWPVMPFAGLELLFVWLAFRTVGAHDGDFERLEVGAGEIRFESRDATRDAKFVANRAWARVVMDQEGGRCSLRLAYAGRTVPLGRLLSDEGRRRLADDLRGRLPVTAN